VKLVLFFAAFLEPFSEGIDGEERAPELSDDCLRVAVVLGARSAVTGGRIFADFGGSPEPVRNFLRIGGRAFD
jgi:hypothetical protein